MPPTVAACGARPDETKGIHMTMTSRYRVLIVAGGLLTTANTRAQHVMRLTCEHDGRARPSRSCSIRATLDGLWSQQWGQVGRMCSSVRVTFPARIRSKPRGHNAPMVAMCGASPDETNKGMRQWHTSTQRHGVACKASLRGAATRARA
jgi:hypothetical protein